MDTTYTNSFTYTHFYPDADTDIKINSRTKCKRN